MHQEIKDGANVGNEERAAISNNPDSRVPDTRGTQKLAYLGEQRRQELLLVLPGRQALVLSLAIAPLLLLQEAMDGLLHQLHLLLPPHCLVHTDASIQGVVVSPVAKVHGGEKDDAEEGMVVVALATD